MWSHWPPNISRTSLLGDLKGHHPLKSLYYSNARPTSNSLWQGVIMGGDRILSGRTAVVFASQAISYWLGEKLGDDQVQALKKRYSDITPRATLRDPFF